MAQSRAASLLTLATLTAAAAAVVWLVCAPGDVVPAAGFGTGPAERLVRDDAAGAGSTATDRAASAVSFAPWTAPVGSRFRYRLDDRCDVALQSDEGGARSGGVLHTRAAVTTTVLDRRAGETLVQHDLDALQFLDATGAPLGRDDHAERFTAAAAAPTVVRLDAAGRVLGYGFPAGLDGDQRNFLRGTLGLLACEAPAAGDTAAWTAPADDTTGTFTARFELLTAPGADEVVVRRTRLEYTSVVGQERPPEHRLRGATEVRFARAHGWLTAVRVREGITLRLPLLDLAANTERTADVELVAADAAPVGADTAAAWADATAPATSRGEALGAAAAACEERLWRERLHGRTLDALLADLHALLAAQPLDQQALDAVFQQLQWLAKLDDRTITDLVGRLGARQLGDAVARVAIGALGAAGTPAAQHALVAVRGDATIGLPLRTAATVSCLQLARPNQALLDSLAGDVGAGGELGGSALLVLGALAPRAEGALADGRTPLQALLAMEAEAEARGELDTWLLAVANAKSPATLAIARRLIEHRSAAVRGAACVAVRDLPAEHALPLLLDQGLADADAMVRHEAVLALSRRGEPAARAGIERASRSDPDLTVRDRAERLLRANG